MKKVMTVSETLKVLGVSLATLRDWDLRGVLPAKRNQFGWRTYDPQDVMDLKPFISTNASGKKLPLNWGKSKS